MGRLHVVRAGSALLAAVAIISAVLLPAGPAATPAGAHGAAPAPGTPSFTVAELEPEPGTYLRLGDRGYGGTLTVTAHPEGLAVVETVSLDGYLAGIREVPFSWPAAALQAQAVAARTYLARTLRGGRRGDGERYGYDICATSACQVYRGQDLSGIEGADRWLAAVAATSGEVLLDGDRPIEAVYHSSAGSRTRANQDVWGGEAVWYLQAVDSPEEGVSPWYAWSFAVPADLFVAVLRADGYGVGGHLVDLRLDDPGEGNGRATLTVVTTSGSERLPLPVLKGVFNRKGKRLWPGALPAHFEDRHLPQVVPSTTFTVRFVPGTVDDPRLPAEDRSPDRVVFEGEGWGHGVGMSQWGAFAMARDGAAYDDILAHYYGGLRPVDGADLLPDEVAVGLATERAEVVIEATGPFRLRLDGLRVGVVPGGTWRLVEREGHLLVLPPFELLGRLVRRLIGLPR